MIADEENNNNNNNNEENDNNINNNNDNNNQNMQPQGQEFYPGSYFSSFLIDGYAEDKYKNTVTQICQNKNLHLLIGLLECLVCNSIIVLLIRG
ncbi:transmembrane protein, putative (macronuclear) [Tetrahymena thermophila SB210]|uniref:Transmembrane protein, putative n=1 Tax=Tetrahymena thermophila (strain SB210) TaxID=312017 RepID=W7XHG3_TETTS|nr:transmembrane protein, putative [Tetrahymena thermophila SB210]EWS76698.1 transmembrane protein, putative [Tetrahymena thermophila SB210]|eukprot:XP_012650768.1 transmembrane protein, putative [Tetrahymena thermophila SB210]